MATNNNLKQKSITNKNDYWKNSIKKKYFPVSLETNIRVKTYKNCSKMNLSGSKEIYRRAINLPSSPDLILKNKWRI